MRYWLHIHNSEPEDCLTLARLAEETGFEGVLGDDHWFMPAGSGNRDPNERGPLPWDYQFPDMFVFGAAALAQTKTLKFGTCVMILANRTNPFLVAKAGATLARISGDRFVLGVGTGWMKDEYDLAGVEWKTRVPRTVEMMEILRKLWGPGPVEHHGRFFDFPPTYAVPAPRKPIPIFMGGIAPEALKRCGRIADGWMGVTSRVTDLAGYVAFINEGRREAGRMGQSFEFMCGLVPHPDGTLPSHDDFRRAEEIGITLGHLGPAEHALGRERVSLDEKKRYIEDFANRVMR